MKKITVISILAIIIFTSVVYADSYVGSPAAQAWFAQKEQQTKIQTYDKAAFHKLSRGGTNVLACWTDIPERVYITSKEEGALTGWTFGVAEGFLSTIGRGVIGLADVLTFPILPEKKPLLEPENPDGNIDAKIQQYAW